MLQLASIIFLSIALSACDLLVERAPQSVMITNKCRIDTVNLNGGDEWIVKPSLLKLNGWAVDEFSNSTPEKIAVQIHNLSGLAVGTAVAKRVHRSDVVDFFKNPGYLKAGFEVTLDIATLTPGNYTFALTMQRENNLIYCATSNKVVIVGNQR